MRLSVHLDTNCYYKCRINMTPSELQYLTGSEYAHKARERGLRLFVYSSETGEQFLYANHSSYNGANFDSSYQSPTDKAKSGDMYYPGAISRIHVNWLKLGRESQKTVVRTTCEETTITIGSTEFKAIQVSIPEEWTNTYINEKEAWQKEKAAFLKAQEEEAAIPRNKKIVNMVKAINAALVEWKAENDPNETGDHGIALKMKDDELAVVILKETIWN